MKQRITGVRCKMIDIKKLQQLTQEAIQRGKEEKQRKIEEDRRKKIAEAESQKVESEKILAQIPGRALIEAQNGKNFAILMNVGSRNYELAKNAPADEMKSEWIEGEVGKLVYKGCVDLGLNPSLEFWHDGVGMYSGYNIVIHW